MKQLLFSKAELLDELGVAENTLRTLIDQRGFPRPRKMGAKLFWLIVEVADWLQSCPAAWCGSSEDGVNSV